MDTARSRAAPLPPEQRRDAIIAAALPLLRRHGTDVTTKQIADAAGVAEGTLFRAFGDKDTLISAAVDEAFDARETVRQLREVDRSLPLRDRMKAAVEIIAARLDAVWELIAALRLFGPPQNRPQGRAAASRDQMRELLPQELMALIEPDAALLRVDTGQAARILNLVTVACTHPRITEANPLTSDEIVDLLLDGLRA